MSDEPKRPARTSKILKGLGVLLLAPLAVGILLLAAAEAWDQVSAKPERTEVRFFVPYDYEGINSRFEIVDQVIGVCHIDYSGSNYAAPEAHRCASSHGIYDPCWEADTWPFDRVLCIGDPWSEEATLLRVRRWEYFRNGKMREWTEDDGFVNRRPPARKQPPWAVELVNGERCVFVTGASYVIVGQRANYMCGDRPSDNWVIGEPDRTEPLWSVAFREEGANETEQVAVRTAWY